MKLAKIFRFKLYIPLLKKIIFEIRDKIIIFKNNQKDKKLFNSYNLPSLLTIFSKFNPEETYSYMNGMFLSKDFPKYIKNHRYYFSKENRGFGENPFHVQWFLIFKEYKPIQVLEIGVYRGQVLTLWGILSKELNIKSSIYGLSPLEDANDSVSNYLKIDYESDIIESCKKFNINKPNLIKEYSNSKVGIDFIKSKKWDLIYIDGSHDYEIVKNDFLNSLSSLKENGLIVMDDSSLYLKYAGRLGGFKGYSGPSRVCVELASFKMKHLGTVGHNNIFQKIK
mgnify:CR=1 FL=1